MRKHSWIWHRTWRFWGIPTRVCVRCKARLRFPKAGPRGGKRYSYAEAGEKRFELVARLPECRDDRAPMGDISEALGRAYPLGSAAAAVEKRSKFAEQLRDADRQPR